MGASLRITGINQPRPIASEDRQYSIETIAHHLLEVAGALTGPVEPVHAFEEPQLRPAFFLGTPALSHIHDGSDEFLELARLGEDWVGDCADVLHRAPRKSDSELQLVVCRLADSSL